MNLLFYLTSLFFFIWMFRNILFWVTLWQLKEYRLDRLFAHFKETAKGRAILTSKFLYIKFLVIIAYVYFALYENNIIYYEVLICLIFAYETFVVLREAYRHTLKRPVPTAKAVLLFGLVSLGVLALYLTPLVTERVLWLLIIDRIMPILSAVFVAFLSFPTEFLQDLQIQKATKKIKEQENLLVIGISGSYGKSSTKDYIAQILSHKYIVLKTEGSHNTPIGIAHAILHGLKQNTAIFVVELGSYKRGEVTELCHIVHPKIGVTTSISDQHLSLFGSIENIFATEKELIDALPDDGLALFNGNNAGAYVLYKQTSKNKVMYEVIDKAMLKKTSLRRKSSPDIFAHSVQMTQKEIQFTISHKGAEYRYTAPLLGVHAVENILPAVYLAHHLGMPYKEIKYAVERLKPLPKRMIRYTLINGGTVIDDTFNASPESIRAALTYVELYKGKKVMVLEPMIELGENAKQAHYDLGKAVAHICDYLFVTNKNYYDSLTKGIKESGKNCEVEVATTKEIIEFINKNIGKNDLVVFEGREGASALNKIV